MLRTSFFAAVLLALQACTAPSTEHSEPEVIIEDEDLLGRLAGHWIAREGINEHWFEEHWTLKDNGDLEGLGLVRSGKDTVMIEYLSIHHTDTATWFSARIPSENESEPVLFRMVSNIDSLSFHSTDIGHPQHITYRPAAVDGWSLRLAGTKHGEAVEEVLLFQAMVSGNTPRP